ncbi:hypothetical protein G6F23_015545 [Rhizopus arrhizus]|nr:hypothetical protein G6F23_015545 [Rhizopus arrhizus]
MPLPAMCLEIIFNARPLLMSSAARLIAMCALRSATSSSRMSRTTFSITRSVTSAIMPASSASGMNRSGRTWVPSGRCQRINASAPTQMPVSSSMIGW